VVYGVVSLLTVEVLCSWGWSVERQWRFHTWKMPCIFMFIWHWCYNWNVINHTESVQ